MKRAHRLNQQRNAILLTKVMCDLSIHLFGKVAMRKTGVLPVIRSLGIRDLTMSLVLIRKPWGVTFKRVPRLNHQNKGIWGKGEFFFS